MTHVFQSLKSWFVAGIVLVGFGFAGGTAVAQPRAEKPKCLFGDDLWALLENTKDFKVKKTAFKTLKMARNDPEKRLVMVGVHVVEDRATKRVFHVNATYNHVDDGDNTWGWIEEVTGAEDHPKTTGDGQDDPNWRAVVADIADSDIYECKFTKR
jgi:hypothetical protein